MCLTGADGYTESCTDDLSCVLGEPGSGTYTKSVILQWVALPLSSWEWVQTYHDTVGSFKSWQGETYCTAPSRVPKHTCSRMQINVAHQNTFWKEILSDWDWPCCWVLIPSCNHLVTALALHVQSSQEQPELLFPQTLSSRVWCVKCKSQVQLLGGWLLTGQVLWAWLWIRLTKGAAESISVRGAGRGLQWWCGWSSEHPSHIVQLTGTETFFVYIDNCT